MDRPDSDASDLKSGNDTETESGDTDTSDVETATPTDTTAEDSMSTNDTTADESTDETKPVAETPQPFPLPVSEIIDELASAKGKAKTQEKQMLAIGGAVVLTGVYMGAKFHPAATVPPGVWNTQVLPVVSALFMLGFGSEGKQALQKANEKRKR